MIFIPRHDNLCVAPSAEGCLREHELRLNPEVFPALRRLDDAIAVVH